MGRLNFGSFGHAKQKPRGPAASLKTSHTTTAGFRSAAVPTESLRVAGCPSKRRPSPQRAFAAPGASSTSASGISARDGIAPKAQSVLLTDAEHAPSRDSQMPRMYFPIVVPPPLSPLPVPARELPQVEIPARDVRGQLAAERRDPGPGDDGLDVIV